MDKPKGWYSRRHETNEANTAARKAYETRAERRPRQVFDPATKTWSKIKV